MPDRYVEADQLEEMRVKYLGKLIRYGSFVVGIVTDVLIYADRYPEEPHDRYSNRLTLDIEARGERPSNYFLKPDLITVWGES